MHMSDALISPVVGGVGWAVAGTLTAYAARRVQREPASNRPAVMGVVGAFVFVAQMINFALPGTGCSGHLGGALLLSVLLGPHAALLVMASVLTVQALLFADGGLLALGCNITNLGLFTCYVAYPLLFRPLAGTSPRRFRLTLAALLAAVAGLGMGALAVVLETTASGISQLPFRSFVLFMVPVHLGIGLVEGLLTAGVLLYVWRARPELLRLRDFGAEARPLRPLLVAFGAATVLIGGGLSWFASTRPDGLAWAVRQVAGQAELAEPETDVHGPLARIRDTTALFPEYKIGSTSGAASEEPEPSWPAPDAGTSLSGVVGGGLVLLVALGLGSGLRALRSRHGKGSPSETQ